MSIEEKLSGWTGPSSDTEQDKQNRAVRMVKEAVAAHAAFASVNLSVFAKGSYANNTNVRSDSDVDVAVRCNDVCYWDEHTTGAHPASTSYTGPWTPAKLRTELTSALKKKFPSDVDDSGKVAIRVNANSARVDADVVPCFDFHYYFSATNYRRGTKVFRKDGTSLVNNPDQQYENGVEKNRRTSRSYKGAVRILKRVENALNAAGLHKDLPSFFMECLVYNCPDEVLLLPSWTETMEEMLAFFSQELTGDEPSDSSDRWLEVNECKYLFHNGQAWGRSDGRSLTKAAQRYLGFSL